MDFPNVTDVGLNPSAMVGVRYAGVAAIAGTWAPDLHRTKDSRRRGGPGEDRAPHPVSRWRGLEHVIAVERGRGAAAGYRRR